MKIGIIPEAEFSGRARLWEGLGALFSIEFAAGGEGADGLIAFCETREEAVRITNGFRSLAFLKDEDAPTSLSQRSEIELTSAVDLAECLRGRTLPHEPFEHVARLEEQVEDKVLARHGNEILWIRSGRGNHSLDLAAVSPPCLRDDEYLFQYFESENWLRLLPLLHFCRELSGWIFPPIRACFMFDDPNLHWSSYGYIDFAELAAHARANNYHVSFATIPLDRWYVHRGTAALFRENAKWLSLCAHGNNHLYFELTETKKTSEQNALAAQAMRRISELEASTGLKVSRVMTAPHGACSQTMASAFLRAGFEAGCISRSSIMGRNPESRWSPWMGLAPAEFLGEGLSVMPRFHMLWDQTYILFSAFLGQPIVPVGHHQDCAGNYELLEKLAGLINSTGEVKWMEMKAISRSNYLTRQSGDTLRVKMFSRRVKLDVPAGIKALELECPWLGNATAQFALLEDGIVKSTHTSTESIPVIGGRTIEVRALPIQSQNDAAIPELPTPLWAYARRHLCEGRDRLAPLVDRFKPRRNGRQ